MEANSTPRRGADHNQCFWNLGELDDRTVGENGFVVRLRCGQRFRFRTAHHQDVGGFDRVFLPSFSTLIFPGPSYLPQPCTHSTLFFLKRNSMPFACFLTILSFPRQDVRPVDFQPADLKSQFRAILEMIVNLRVVQQHLGGNAPDVQTGSAEKGSFSTTTVFSPNSPARIAATYPPGPLR